MKTNVTISLDIEISERLRKMKDYSGFINRLLRERFAVETISAECVHQWSNAFSTADGLVKECLLCHETKKVEIQ